MKGPGYWKLVRWIIIQRCAKKGLPLNGMIYQWIDAQVGRQKERWQMKLARAVQV